MSTAGGGEIIALPLVVAAAVPLAGMVLVAGVGVGICYVAGKGLIAGADAVHRRCQEHAAQRRAWDQTRRNLYRASQATAAPEFRPAQRQQFESYRRQQEQALARLTATRAWLTAPLGQPEPFTAPPIDEDMRVAWPEVGQQRVVDVLDVEAQRDRLAARHRAARRAVLAYGRQGAWEGLYDVAPVVNRLAQAETELDDGNLLAAAERLRQAERLLSLMESEAVARWGQRADALTALQEADEQLRRAAAVADEHPEVLDQLASLAEILTTAQEQYGRRDFTAAQAAAQTVGRQGGVLVATPQLWRRELLRAEIDALREEIAGHGPFDAATAQIRQLDAAAALIAGDAPTEAALAQAAEMLDAALTWADDTLRRVETTAAGSLARLHMAAHSATQLEAMHYTVEWSHPLDAPPLPEEKLRLTGRRPAPTDPQREQTFIIDLAADGSVWFDVTQGYRGRECDDIKTFIQGLQNRGVRGFWEPFYSAEQAASRFREMLTREGYIFYEESTDDGLVYTLVKDGQTAPGARIGWDGQIESAVTEDAFVEAYLDRVRAEIEAAERQQGPARLHY